MKSKSIGTHVAPKKLYECNDFLVTLMSKMLSV